MKNVFALLTAALLLSGCTELTPPVPGTGPGPGDGGGGVVTPAPSFTLTVPASLSVGVGQVVTLTPTVTRDNYTAEITLGVSAPGVQLSRSGDTFSLMSSAPGTFAVTVTATGADGQVKSAPSTLTVTAEVRPNPTPQPDPQPQPQPQPQPLPVFLPAPGAAVGSGSGTKEGTVYVSPSAQEIEVLTLVNEVRTKGTLNGAPATAGTCVDGSWSPRGALTYNGLFAYAARKHAEYMSNVGYEGHVESQSNSPYFYGATVRDRVVRAYREQAGLSKSYVGENNTYDGGELAGLGTNSPTALAQVNWWLKSPGHCAAMMNTSIQQFGAGHSTLQSTARLDTWALIVSR